MDEALLKQNTDCVYFLASPLTCKKGADCEFRHSNFARLNPRDCWYWLAGNCLHPTCAFRHPPLDGHVEAPLESAPSSVSTDKPNVPCYYYFKGFCNKGDSCSFLHDIDGGASTGKYAETATECNDALAHPSENKASAGNGTLYVPRMTDLNPSETASKATVDTEFQSEEVLYYHEQPVLRDGPQKSVCLQIPVSGDEEAGEISVSGDEEAGGISVSDDEEAGEIRSDLLPVEGSIENKSHSSTNGSSEEQDDELLVSEAWRESSSGFDVRVDGKAEYLGCKDDPEYDPQYFVALDEERRELNSHFLGYGSENPDEYDPAYPDAGLLYERDVYSSYGCLHNRIPFGNDREIPGYTKERMLDSIFPCKSKFTLAADDQDLLDLRDCLRRRRVTDGRSLTGVAYERDIYSSYGCLDNRIAFGNDREISSYRKETMLDSIFPCKRRFTQMELAADDQDLLDLRDHLRRRVTDGRSLTGLASRRDESLRLFDRVGQMPQRRVTGWRLQERLASEVGRTTHEPLRGNATSFDGVIQHGSLRHSHQHSHSNHHKERRLTKQQLPPWAVLREKRCAKWSAGITGPKNVSKIKQKKRKAEATRGCSRVRKHGERTTVDFQGPKPFNEILKEKGKEVAD